jgi:hypothetical protein
MGFCFFKKRKEAKEKKGHGMSMGKLWGKSSHVRARLAQLSFTCRAVF